MSNNTKNDLQEIANCIRKEKVPNTYIQEKYPIYKFNDTWYLSCIGKTNSSYYVHEFKVLGVILGKNRGDILSLKIPLSKLGEFLQLEGISYLQIAGKIAHALDHSLKDIHADSVHKGINLPQSYTGKNVLIGITDWGFDYSSPMFYDTLLNQTRIVAAWDQYKQVGNLPSGFNYGVEYFTSTALINAGSDTSNIYSFHTHGTHVAGICGGSGAGTSYRGIAFESGFLLATFLVDEASVIDAWEWMYQKSVLLDKRLVVNMSWGLYHMGTLDGNSLLSQAITHYTDLGVVFVNSGGNNGGVNFHIKKNFQQDSISTKVNFYNYASNANMWGQSIHAWGEVGKPFEVKMEVRNSSSTLLNSTVYFPTIDQYKDTFMVVGIDTIFYNVTSDLAHPLNQKPQMRFRVKCKNASYRIMMVAKADQGLVHFWNVTELVTDVGNWGMPFSAVNSVTVNGDNQYGISEPSCATDVLSVAAYAPQYLSGSNLVGGDFASFSSVGPRIDGVLKPEISAPGVNITSSISSYTDASYTSVQTISFNGRTYPFAKFSGTSMASPMVTGVAALVLEANPYLSARQVKQVIMDAARLDQFTGQILMTGSPIWGKGKLNAYFAVKLALEVVGVEEVENDAQLWTVYPNPVSDVLHFTLLDELPNQAQIVSLEGKTILKDITYGSIQLKDLSPGIYWVRLELNGRIQQQKIIVQ